MIFSNSCT